MDRDAPESVLRSDPALLFYLTRDVVEAGGTPKDWGAEPRLAWPETIDVAASYTVAQEYLVLAARRLLGDRLPLHILVIGVMALTASLAGMGVYLLGRELSGSALGGLGATCLFALLPGSYRSLGFVMVREDLALPIYALHLALALRAWRVGTPLAWMGAGLSLGATMATWHAGGLLATAELGVCASLALLGGSNGLAAAKAPWGLAAMSVVCVLNPALRAKGAIFDLPVLLSGVLILVARCPWGIKRWNLALGLVLVATLRLGLFPSQDMGHVTRLLAAKLLFLGIPPGDPELIGFEARMMWQGPFATMGAQSLWHFFRLAILVVPFVILSGWRGRRVRGEAFLLGLLGAGLVLAWIAQRMVVLPILVLAPLLALNAGRAVRASTRPFGALGVAALVFFQGLLFLGWANDPPLAWTNERRAQDTKDLVVAVREHVPAWDAIAADFMLNPVLLATCGNPMVLQPKWERRSARERVEAFWDAFYGGGPAELAHLLQERFECHWLVVDRQTLGSMRASLYLAGIPAQAGLADESAAWALCGGDGRGVPGFDLVWQSPSPSGATGLFRLYRLQSR